MFRKAVWLGFLVSAFSLSACTAAAPDDAGAEDPTGELGEESSFSGGWRFYNWDFSCESSKLTNSVKPKSRRHVYRFWGKSGKLGLELDASWPKSYGAIVIVMDSSGGLVDWAYGNTAHLSLDVELKQDGAYWVFVSPAQHQNVTKSWSYVLEAKCASCDTDADCDGGQRCVTPVCITTPCDFPGQCVDQPLCAQYETSDGRFYAKNFAPGEWDAAQAWTLLDPEVMASGVSLGTCLDANSKPCPSTDPPVCGVPISTDVAATYAGVCEFQKVVREAAGTSGESKGKYTPGACATAFCATASFASEGNLTLYAKNFTDQAAAEAYLAQTFPTATSTKIFESECDTPHACIELYAPVCGVVGAGAEATYSNQCFFEGAVMAAAGSTGSSKGSSTKGACTPVCDYSAPGKTWVAKSPAQCALVKYYCTPPAVPFSDECGCGCVQPTK